MIQTNRAIYLHYTDEDTHKSLTVNQQLTSDTSQIPPSPTPSSFEDNIDTTGMAGRSHI